MIEYENLRKLNAPFFDDFRYSFEEILNNGWYILGEKVERFEREFAAYLNVNHCIGVASGLDALLLALNALNLKAGSEVIVASNTYIATIVAIIQAGLKPVLVEPDIKTYNIDPNKIEKHISAKTSAIMIVHLYGKSCEMDAIVEICNRRKLQLIEDCAQAHGARYKGKMVGTFGQFGCFSFYPTKNLGALGDAGGLVTNDAYLDKCVRQLRNYGSKKKYYNEVVGFNSRLDEVQAGFLSAKLKALDVINAHKRQLALVYFEHLPPFVVVPTLSRECFDVYHIFNIRSRCRDALKQFLFNKGIQTEIHYPVPPHKQKAMTKYIQGEYLISDEIHNTTLSLPISYFHTEKDIKMVCDAIREFES